MATHQNPVGPIRFEQDWPTYSHTEYLAASNGSVSVSVSRFPSLPISLWLSLTHSSSGWKAGERRRPTGRDTETEPRSVCMTPAFGEPKVQFRLHKRASASSLRDPDPDHESPVSQADELISTYFLLAAYAMVFIWTLTLTPGLFRWIQRRWGERREDERR